MTPGDWSTIANVNVQATLPYTGSNSWGQVATLTDHLTFNSASFVPNAPNSDAGYIWLTNTSQPAASYHIALGVTPQIRLSKSSPTTTSAHMAPGIRPKSKT